MAYLFNQKQNFSGWISAGIPLNCLISGNLQTGLNKTIFIWLMPSIKRNIITTVLLAFMHSCIHASMPPMFTKRQNLSEFSESLSFLSLCLQNNVYTWHASADRCSSGVLLLHFMPLFAQRLGAIIGTTTQHYSYLSTHTQVQKDQRIEVCARGQHLCTQMHEHNC